MVKGGGVAGIGAMRAVGVKVGPAWWNGFASATHRCLTALGDVVRREVMRGGAMEILLLDHLDDGGKERNLALLGRRLAMRACLVGLSGMPPQPPLCLRA